MHISKNFLKCEKTNTDTFQTYWTLLKKMKAAHFTYWNIINGEVEEIINPVYRTDSCLQIASPYIIL